MNPVPILGLQFQNFFISKNVSRSKTLSRSKALSSSKNISRSKTPSIVVRLLEVRFSVVRVLVERL